VAIFETSERGIVARGDGLVLEVTASAPGAIRVAAARGDALPERASWAVLPTLWDTDVTVEHRGAGRFSTGELTVRIDAATLALTIEDSDGRVLCRDDDEDPIRFSGAGFRLRKHAPAGEFHYGLGDKPGPLEKRGHAYTMWNTDAYGYQEAWDPLYKTVPFLLAVRPGGFAWGLLLDSTHRCSFDLAVSETDVLGMAAEGGPVRYHVLAGPTAAAVLERFTRLVGRMPLPPLWALGYQQCRYSYDTAARAIEVVATHRAKAIPLDVIWLDIGFQDRNRPFTASPDAYPDLGGTVADIAGMDVRTVVIADLHVPQAPGYAPYDSGLAGGHFVQAATGGDYVGEVWPGDCVFPDFTRAATRDWWGTLHRQFAVEYGIAGFWNDMNEPAVFEVPGHTMPGDVRHRIEEPGFETRTTDHAEIHNVYGMQNARATHEGLLALLPDRRPFVMTRASYAGGHRHAVTWTGDNSSTENHLRLSTPQLLSLGLSGFAMAGCDIGGFKGDPTPELLTRWIAQGAFNPIMRNHTDLDTRDQEAWVDGPDHEALRRASIEARYRLLPYLYTCIEETTRSGLPLMRPMFLEFDDLALRQEEGQFMLGRALLVAPPPVDGMGDYKLVLPEGVDWFDFWTGERVTVTPKMRLGRRLGHVPVFARAGTIVPMQAVVQHTGETPRGNLELHVYPGPDCRGSVYADDGTTHAYRDGEFLRQDFRWKDGQLIREAPSGRFTPWWNDIDVVVHG
jgi:alpha-glucosidase